MLALGAFLLVYAGWLASDWSGINRQLIGDLAVLAVNGAAVLTAWRGSRRCARNRRLAQAWRLIAVALGMHLAGELVQLVYDISATHTAHPSIADGFYLAFYPLMLLAVLRLPAARRVGQGAVELALDVAIVAIGAGALVVYVVLGPAAVKGATSALRAMLSIAYPVGDVVLLVGLGSVLLRGGLEGSRRTLRVIELGLIAILAADLVQGYIWLHGAQRGGAAVDGLWMLALALFAIAPTLQRVPRRADRFGAQQPASASRMHLTWLPYAAVATGFTMLAISDGREHFFPEQTLAFVAIMLAALVVTRQLLAQRRLLAVQVQLQEAHDRLEALATTDTLTGLPNHGAIVDAIDVELKRARRHGRSFALLFIDLDHFKRLNDSYGHLAGDDALRSLGRVLRDCLRTIDTVGRWGGEEFVAVLPESDGGDAVATAERIRALVAEHGFDGQGLGMTCSIGVASYPEDAGSRSKLLDLADAAMYAAKATGRNCTVAAGEAYAHRPRLRRPSADGPALARASRQLVQSRSKPAA